MSDESEQILSADDEGDQVLTAGAARILDCTPDGVRYLERKGYLQAERVGGVRIFRRAAVEKLRRERQRRAPAPPPRPSIGTMDE